MVDEVMEAGQKKRLINNRCSQGHTTASQQFSNRPPRLSLRELLPATKEHVNTQKLHTMTLQYTTTGHKLLNRIRVDVSNALHPVHRQTSNPRDVTSEKNSGCVTTT